MMSENAETDSTKNYITLNQLPVEIILHIFQFVDAGFLSTSVSKVCKRFSELLQDDSSWKIRMHIKWPSKYLIPPGETVDWKEACVQREKQYNYWSNHDVNMKLSVLPIIHIAIIDCYYKLPNQRLTTASRDRSFCIWDVNRLNFDQTDDDVLIHHSVDAHDGWIWCIDGKDEKMFTGGFDRTVKCWDINILSSTNTYSYTESIISLKYEDSVLYTGSVNGIVRSVDYRTPDQTRQTRYHSRAVLGLTVVDHRYLITISEDKTLIARDLRASNKMLKKTEFENFPTSIFNGGSHVWVGDRGGAMHMLECQGFNTVKVWNNVHKRNITALEYSSGAITTVSTDKTICILEPTEEATVVARIETKEELTGFARFGDKLISSTTGLDVAVWSPNED